MRKYRKHTQKRPKRKGGELFSGFGKVPEAIVPQVKVSYARGKKFFGLVSESKDVATFLYKIYDKRKIQLQESFVVLYLNKRNEIIGYYRHSEGAIDEILVDLRIILATALTSLSTSIIVSHNHPSGKAAPSESDIKLTNKILHAAKLLDIGLLDHIIVTKHGYYSFADAHLLDK